MLQEVIRIALSLVPPAKGITATNVGPDTTFTDLGFLEVEVAQFFHELEELEGEVKKISDNDRERLTTLGAVANFLAARKQSA